MLNQQSELFRGLNYPWGVGAHPEPGQPEEVADGVYWARIPMPIALDHINVWLLEDDAGWTVVDTGLFLPATQELWQQMFAGVMKGKPVQRIICTHMHPDHVGMAGWLGEQFQAELWMSREEYLMCRALVADTGRPAPDVAIRFFRGAGYTEEQLEVYRQKFGRFGSLVSPLPDSYRRLVDGETIQINDRYWQVVVGTGHSPQHICLYCPALKLLISGDQVLPKITPNVSVFPTEPYGDPLTEWLRSNARIRDTLPDDVLVLPAHEAPFYGLHVRLTQVIESHERDLDQLFDHLEQPRRVVDCFPALFKRDIDKDNLGLATGETLAHLNCLSGRRRIRVSQDERGVNWYQQKPEMVDFE